MGSGGVEQKVLFRTGCFLGFIQGWRIIFWFLVFIKETRMRGELKLFLCNPRNRKIPLKSTASYAKNINCSLEMGCWEVLGS